MGAVRRKNLSEQVAARIKGLIVDNSLKPGDRLPTEQEMADRFGVSRVSVREATKALSFLGIIRAAPRRGLTVGEIDMGRVTEYLGFHFALSSYPKAELLQTRVVIESGALPYIMQAMAEDSGRYDQLRAITTELADARDLEQRIRADIAFHRALLEASGLGPLLVFNDLLQLFFNRFRESFLEAEWATAVEHHVRIIDALRDGKLDAARDTMHEHLKHYKHHR